MTSEMTSRCWGDIMVQLDEDRSQFVLRMSDAQWKEYAKKAIANNRGKGDLRPVLNWLDAMDAKRAVKSTGAKAPAKDMDPDAVLFRVWRDMVLEPFKYGDADWEEWLVMDAQLRAGPKRWRVAAVWTELDEANQAFVRARAATQIQAVWRGHATRDAQVGLSCEDCLARRISPKRFNEKHLCEDCWMHCIEHWTPFVQPVVPPALRVPEPRAEPNEHGCVPCDGCGRVVVDAGDYGEYRPGWWCSRRCAYE